MTCELARQVDHRHEKLPVPPVSFSDIESETGFRRAKAGIAVRGAFLSGWGPVESGGIRADVSRVCLTRSGVSRPMAVHWARAWSLSSNSALYDCFASSVRNERWMSSSTGSREAWSLSSWAEARRGSIRSRLASSRKSLPVS